MEGDEVEWRRRWTNSLKCCSWVNLTVDGADGRCPLFVKYFSDENHYEILFSDLTNTWMEQLKREDIEQRCKEINPTVEVPLVKLLNQLDEVLRDRNNATSFKLIPSLESTVLTVSFKFVGLSFSWKFCGKPVDPSVVYAHLMSPLMTMISHLTHQRDQLIHLLKSKDKEISDLKSQGIQTSRKNLETKTFDETSFVNEMLSSKEFEDQVRTEGKSNAFNDHGRKLYSAVMVKADWLKDRAKANLREVCAKDETFDNSVNPTIPQNGGNSWASNRVPGTLMTPALNMTPDTSPNKSHLKPETAKEAELLRRQQLEERLAEREEKDQKKKKKKLKF